MLRILKTLRRQFYAHRLPIRASNNNIFLPEHGIILFCVAKAGNTSIKRAVIDALVKIGDPLTKDRWEGTKVPWINTHHHPALHRTPLAEIAADPRTRDCFKAVFVRHPLDRLMSCYTDRVLGGKRLGRLPVSPKMTFPEFVDVVCAVPDEETDIHVESQYRSFVHEGKCLADLIGKVEDFDAGWEQVRQRSRLPLGPSRSDNRSRKQKAAPSGHDPRIIQAVASRYERDFELLGYS